MELINKLDDLSFSDLKAIRDYARERKDLFAALRTEYYSKGNIEASDTALVSGVYQETLMLEAESAIDRKISQLFVDSEDDKQCENVLDSIIVQ
ncbi:MAG: hypothetical protein ABI954_00360 [Pyrinomonadaceae bacterium]